MVDPGGPPPFALCREAETLDFCLFHLPTWRHAYPVTLNGFYEELIGSVKLADALGWRSYRTTEHHFHYYGGAVPNPALYLTALARETRQIRLGTAVSLLPLRHPLQVAEDLASLDQFSGGRAEIGLSRGFVPHEFAAFGVTREESAARMYEGLEVIEKFWAGEPFAHAGRFWSFDTVEPWPAPVQPEPSIWIAASNDRGSFEAAGRRGCRGRTRGDLHRQDERQQHDDEESRMSHFPGTPGGPARLSAILHRSARLQAIPVHNDSRVFAPPRAWRRRKNG